MLNDVNFYGFQYKNYNPFDKLFFNCYAIKNYNYIFIIHKQKFLKMFLSIQRNKVVRDRLKIFFYQPLILNIINQLMLIFPGT